MRRRPFRRCAAAPRRFLRRLTACALPRRSEAGKIHPSPLHPATFPTLVPLFLPSLSLQSSCQKGAGRQPKPHPPLPSNSVLPPALSSLSRPLTQAAERASVPPPPIPPLSLHLASSPCRPAPHSISIPRPTPPLVEPVNGTEVQAGRPAGRPAAAAAAAAIAATAAAAAAAIVATNARVEVRPTKARGGGVWGEG